MGDPDPPVALDLPRFDGRHTPPGGHNTHWKRTRAPRPSPFAQQPPSPTRTRLSATSPMKKKNISPTEIFWKPKSYGLNDPVRRFLKQWFKQVLAYRKQRAGGGDVPSTTSSSSSSPSSPPPEARLLFIGDSLSRNMHMSLIHQALEEGLGPEDDPYSAFVRRVVKKGGDTYQTMYVTWPGSTKPAEGFYHPSSTNGTVDVNLAEAHSVTAPMTAVIKIRYETAMYFGMDTHSIKSSRGLEFNPTHVFIGRGMWDVIHGRPRDPSIALSGLSAGLVRLRKELSELREGLTPEERKLYPPTRVVYCAAPKLFKSWEPGAKAQHCGFDQEQNYFRDALYAAVRRANGALQHMHPKERFDSVAIELFDYYAMSMAAGAVHTNNGDCVHPAPTPQLAILAQMLDLVSLPPQELETIKQLVTKSSDGRNSEPFLNATMYITPPLRVLEAKAPANSCPLSFTLHDVNAILHPALLTDVGASAAMSELIEDLTPPPLQSIPTSVGKELFVSMMSCQVVETLSVGAVRPVELARKVLEKAMAIANTSATVASPTSSSVPQHQGDDDLTVSQRRSDYLSICATMLYSYLLSHHTLLPFYTQAIKVPLLTSKPRTPELLWAGNRCLQFINREAATLGPEAFFQQLWGYTERHRMICAVVPLISGLLRQPAHESLASGLHGGDELAQCAETRNGDGLRLHTKP